MHPDAMKELVRLCDLVESGDLPETAIPRLCYFGHTLICTRRASLRKFKCVGCGTEFEVQEDHEAERIQFADDTCPTCENNLEVYDITGDDQIGDWQCKSCNHEWRSENGHVCPACGAKEPKDYEDKATSDTSGN